MPEFVRSIASRLRVFVGNRRHAPRVRLRLACRVTLLRHASATTTNISSSDNLHARPARPHRGDEEATRAALTLEGHTLDVSATGLALILPAIRVGEHYLTGADTRLRITLQLPGGGGEITLSAAPARYEQLERDGDETGYLVGVHITDITAHDHARLAERMKDEQK